MILALQLKEKYMGQGEKKKSLEIATNLLKMGLDISAVKEATGLDDEVLGELKSGLDS